jgi:rare lipoprotein A
MEKLTAAHRTLPFETWVRVENLANGKEVNVRITDRGPFIDRRIIDLSRAAARKIDLLGPGTARVRIEVIRAPESEAASEGGFAVQVGAFREKRRAEETARRMRGQHGESRLVEREGQGTVYRVLVGRFPERLGAEELAARLKPEFPSAFVVRIDD